MTIPPLRPILVALAALLGVFILALAGILWYDGALQTPTSPAPGSSPPAISLAENPSSNTLNTTRLGSDDPVETAVAIAQLAYPALQVEDTPAAVVLVDLDNLPSALVAANRLQASPLNAPLLYTTQAGLPELTRQELLRLHPQGVLTDGNVQVYLVGSFDAGLQRQIEALGYRTRTIWGQDPVELAVAADDWASTQTGDHTDLIAIANLDHLAPALPAAFWNAQAGQGFAYITDQGVPEATRRMLQRRAHSPWLYLIGDESVISAQTASELAAYGHVVRVPGAGPLETSLALAGFQDSGPNQEALPWGETYRFGWGLRDAGHNFVFASLDGPGGWQNLLAAASLSLSGKHAPLLVLGNGPTDLETAAPPSLGQPLPPAVASYLALVRPYPSAPRQQVLNHGWIIGSQADISWETQVAIDRLLEAYPYGAGPQAGIQSGLGVGEWRSQAATPGHPGEAIQP